MEILKWYTILILGVVSVFSLVKMLTEEYKQDRLAFFGTIILLAPMLFFLLNC